MKKFVVQKRIGDRYTTLGFYQDKEMALREGKRFFQEAAEKCSVVCIRAEVDEDGNVDRSKYQLYDAWR